MAKSHINARECSRNTIDYPIHEDRPGANALVASPRRATVPQIAAKLADVEPVKTRRWTIPRGYIETLGAAFVLGVVWFEAVCNSGHGLAFHLTRSLFAGFIFLAGAAFAWVFGWRAFALWTALALICTALALAAGAR